MSSFDGQTIDFVSVLEAMPQPIAVCNVEGEVMFLNGTARRFLGVGDGPDLPSFALARRETFSQVRISSEGPIKEYFLADVNVEGAKRKKVSLSLSPLGDWGYRAVLEARPSSVVGSILDELDALVAICDGRRRIRLANSALSKLLVELDGDRQGQDLLELFREEDRPDLRVAASEALAGGSPDEFDVNLSVPGLAKGSRQVRIRIRPLEKEFSPGSEKGHRGLLMVAQPGEASFSELQRRFERAEELMSLGELATGVAHELKNPLTSILNYAEYLLDKYRGQFIEESDGMRLRRIVEGVQRIDRFVHDLLHLAGTDEPQRVAVDVHGVLKASAALSRRILEENQAQLQWELADQSPRVHGHSGGLKQVFGNLIRNAARAMPESGGTITLRTEIDGDWLQVQVDDTARGMSEETCKRIFEPFFSRSSDGNGSGLGLALVQRLVDEHHGQIEVESTPGEGTCFTLRFPLSE